MGTTQRIRPGVPGEPNWGNLSRSISSIAKTVEKEQEEDTEEDANPSEPHREEEAKHHAALILRRNHHIRSAFKRLIETGGGRQSISSGRSRSLGRAGLRSTRKLVYFISNAASQGLQPLLDEIGFGSLTGKTVKDVIDYLLIYCTDSSAGMDETAANNATCEVLKLLDIQSNNNLEDFEQSLKDYIDGSGLGDMLCSFWGHYIYEHLSQRFQEKITQEKGEAISNETFRIIKADIMGQVRLLNENRPVSQIDWRGEEGINAIKEIFESIIRLFE